MTANEKFNARMISLFLFQYTILVPLMDKGFNSVLVALFSGSLILALIIKNRDCLVNSKPIVVAVLVFLVLLFRIVFFGGTFSSVLSTMAVIAPACIIFIYPFDYSEFIKTSEIVAVVCFIELCLFPFSSGYNVHEYMRFGYGMLPVVIFLYIRFFYHSDGFKKVLTLILLAVSFLEMLLYGPRGAVFCMILFFCFDFFVINKQKAKRNMLIIILILVVCINFVSILETLEEVVKALGIKSYSIKKFRMAVEKGLAASSSGRENIYGRALGRILERPILGGSFDAGEGKYTHNLFLQVMADLGIFGLGLVVFLLAVVIGRLFRKKGSTECKLIYDVLFSVSVGRLMLSSTLWMRPEFWMMVCFLITDMEKGYASNLVCNVTNRPSGSVELIEIKDKR